MPRKNSKIKIEQVKEPLQTEKVKETTRQVVVSWIPVDVRWFVIKSILECCCRVNHVSSRCMKNSLGNHLF
jgi:hypothetical protein